MSGAGVFLRRLSAAGRAGGVGALAVSLSLVHAVDRDKRLVQSAGVARGDRLEKLERALLRLEHKLDRVDIKHPKGMPIDVVLGAQW